MQLARILTRWLNDKGKVFIPAFSLGRTQELVYEMDRIFSDSRYGTLTPELQGKRRPPVFMNSPMGLEVTHIYSRLSEYWDAETRGIQHRGDHPLDFDGLYAVQSHRDHQDLCEVKGPAVIRAGSGMFTGGRIIDHLRQGIDRPENDILFVGYQAVGTPGRAILDFARRPGASVLIDGKRKPIKAGVHKLPGYSAHADQRALIAWLESMPQKPGAVKLVHGQRSERSALSTELMKRRFNIVH